MKQALSISIYSHLHWCWHFHACFVCIEIYRLRINLIWQKHNSHYGLSLHPLPGQNCCNMAVWVWSTQPRGYPRYLWLFLIYLVSDLEDLESNWWYCSQIHSTHSPSLSPWQRRLRLPAWTHTCQSRLLPWQAPDSFANKSVHFHPSHYNSSRTCMFEG